MRMAENEDDRQRDERMAERMAESEDGRGREWQTQRVTEDDLLKKDTTTTTTTNTNHSSSSSNDNNNKQQTFKGQNQTELPRSSCSPPLPKFNAGDSFFSFFLSSPTKRKRKEREVSEKEKNNSLTLHPERSAFCHHLPFCHPWLHSIHNFV